MTIRANEAGRDAVQVRLAEGLLGQWYAVAKSAQVRPGLPHGVKALGRHLVLWRDEAGTLQCVEDFCPHRGARLSRGEVHEGQIACRYHGVMLDGTGTVTRVPAMPGCALEGRKALDSYAVLEANDGVFVYFPSVEKPEPTPLALPEEFNNPDWSTFLCMTKWDTSYLFVYDNFADPMHACYLHSDSFTLAYGARQDVMKVEERDDGFHIAKVAQQDVNLDWTHMVIDGNQLYCRLDIPYPPGAGPGGPFQIIGYSTPIDETTCMSFFWRCRRVKGIARESWRLMYRARLEARHWAVLEQDHHMLAHIPADAQKREMLYQHDIGVSRMRRMLVQQARSQLAAEAAATAQVAV